MRSRKKSRAAAGVRNGTDESAVEQREAVDLGSDARVPGGDAVRDVPATVEPESSLAPAMTADADGVELPASEAAVEDHSVTPSDASVDEGTDDRSAMKPADAGEPSDPRELLAYLKQRVLEMPNDVGARLRLAGLHGARSEPLLALEQYQAAAAVDPDNASVTLHFAQALTDLNRFAEAERELRRSLKLEPDHGGLHLQLGTISFRRGLYSQAEVELKRAIELLPDTASAYFHRGEALNQLSRIDEALDMLERGVALDPNYSRAYYIMGILYDRKSRPQEAGAMYKKAREVSGT